jgi:hypothetical protein
MSTSAGRRQTDVAINLVVLTLLEVTRVGVLGLMAVISWDLTGERAMVSNNPNMKIRNGHLKSGAANRI